MLQRIDDHRVCLHGSHYVSHYVFTVQVAYPSLEKHLCVGGVFLNLLLDGADEVIPSSSEFAAVYQAGNNMILCMALSTDGASETGYPVRQPYYNCVSVCQLRCKTYRV